MAEDFLIGESLLIPDSFLDPIDYSASLLLRYALSAAIYGSSSESQSSSY